MKNIRLISGAILLTLLAVVLLQNSTRVTLSVIALNIKLPLFLVVLLAASIGFAIGWLFRAKH